MAKTTGTFVGTGEWDDAAKTFTITGTPGPAGPMGPPGPQGPPGTSTSPPVSPPVSPPSGGGGFQLGDIPFASSSSWNVKLPQNVTLRNLSWPAPVSGGYNYTVGWDAYSPAVVVSTDTDPVVRVKIPDTWGWPASNIAVKVKRGVTGAAGSDGELLVIDGDIVHNFWQFNRTSDTAATAAAYGSTNIKTGTGWGQQSPFKGAGIMANGASMMAGLLVQAETDKGVIPHAIQLVVDRPLCKPGKTGEAINSDGGSSTGIVQESDHLAIPRSTAKPSGMTPIAGMVFVAMQEYGAFVCDVADQCSKLRAQQNAFDAATINALWPCMQKIIPLLKKVS